MSQSAQPRSRRAGGGRWHATAPSGRRAMLALAAAFALTLGFAAFVSVLAFHQVEDRLAQTFADQQYANSVSAALRLRDRYHMACLALTDLARDLRGEPGLGDPGRLRQAARVFDAGRVGFFRLDRGGQVLARWPADAPTPSAEVLAMLRARTPRDERPRPVFDRDREGHPRLVAGAWLPSAPEELVGLSMDLTNTLEPARVGTRASGPVMVVEPRRQVIVASTEKLAPGTRFDALFQTDTGTLIEQVRAGQSGVERAAQRAGERRALHLMGVTGLRLGDDSLIVAVSAPRAAMVQPYLRHVLRWILIIGGVVLLALASFAVVMAQAVAASRQARRRSEERQALYHISQALLSASALDDVLQRITDQARDLFRAECAALSLVDAPAGEVVYRWASSSDPAQAARLSGARVAVGAGLAGWVVARNEAVLAVDAAGDTRFTPDPAECVTHAGTSLICAPLRDQRGACFGAIGLLNHEGEPFGGSDLVLLQSLAATAAAAVERAMLLEHEKVQARLKREMEIARAVQQDLLPKAPPRLPGLEFAGASQSAAQVGGDFYDFLRLDERHLGLVIADVADKGLGAAMFMVVCRGLLYACAVGELSPARVLAELNSRLLEVSGSELFVTVFYAVIDTVEHRVTFSSAGHNPPLLHRAGSAELTPLVARGMALGIMEPLALAEDAVDLAPGDRLLLYTDGVTDAIDAESTMFGLGRLRQTMLDSAPASAEETVAAVLGAVDGFVGAAEQFDDLTLAVVRVTGPAAPVS